MNVFDDQKFLLRLPPTPGHPLGEQVRRSFREIMTGPDEDCRFDYPLECYNVGALLLCAALAQAFFEPADADALAERFTAPLTEEEFETAAGAYRDLFSIDGAQRFLQGRAPERDKHGRLVDMGELADRLSLTASAFMNRPEEDWVVALDQIPLLLFTRATFYEKSAGRGYMTGTSGDLEIRTMLLQPGSLRKSIWLNVLAADKHAPDFTPIGSAKGYDDWMWAAPPKEDVPQGRISLRAGLFWMVATGYIEIEERDTPSPCMVTGELVAGRVGVSVYARATGIGFGAMVAREAGPDVRQSFFRHPNAPWYTFQTKQGLHITKHLSVDRVSGLIGQMAGLFFSSSGSGDRRHHVAPTVAQLYDLVDALVERGEGPLYPVLQCFGFHMLSSKQNIHGGYEFEQFRYPILGHQGEAAGERMMDAAHGIVNGCATAAGSIRQILCKAVQLCMMVQVDSDVKDNTLQLTTKSTVEDKSFANDFGRELWRNAGRHVGELLVRIAGKAGSAQELEGASEEILEWWNRAVGTHARALFERVFEDHAASPQHLLAAHNARRYFFGGLYNCGVRFNAAA